MSEDSKLVRVNTRVSSDLNDWLDEHSSKTGLSKSTIIMLATENYRQQTDVMQKIGDMGLILEKLEKMEQKLKENE